MHIPDRKLNHANATVPICTDRAKAGPLILFFDRDRHFETS